jgi:hypothetical protein
MSSDLWDRVDQVFVVERLPDNVVEHPSFEHDSRATVACFCGVHRSRLTAARLRLFSSANLIYLTPNAAKYFHPTFLKIADSEMQRGSLGSEIVEIARYLCSFDTPWGNFSRAFSEEQQSVTAQVVHHLAGLEKEQFATGHFSDAWDTYWKHLSERGRLDSPSPPNVGE